MISRKVHGFLVYVDTDGMVHFEKGDEFYRLLKVRDGFSKWKEGDFERIYDGEMRFNTFRELATHRHLIYIKQNGKMVKMP